MYNWTTATAWGRQARTLCGPWALWHPLSTLVLQVGISGRLQWSLSLYAPWHGFSFLRSHHLRLPLPGSKACGLHRVWQMLSLIERAAQFPSQLRVTTLCLQPHTALGGFTSADKPDPLQRLPSFLSTATGGRVLALLLKIRTTNR